MSRVITTAYGRPALDALAAQVRAAKRDDPMAPVTVLVPNNLAGIVARRHLATTGGIAGIEFTTLSRLAERHAAPTLAPRRPATRTIVSAAWRRALAAEPGRFADIATHPATVRALAAAHRELRTISARARAALGGTSAVARDLVRLHEQVVADLRIDWYDSVDLLETAASNPPQLGDGILYLPQALTPPELRFADALGQLSVIVASTGVARADKAVARTVAALANAAVGPAPRPTATDVLTASDSDDEVRCVVRDVVQTLQATKAHRVAVLYSAPQPYARLLHEHLAAAGVAVNGAGVRPADERAVARVLVETLALAGGDVPRGDLFRALAHAPTHDFDGNRIPVATWERVSRAAGVVRGDDWEQRIDVYVADREATIAVEQTNTDARPWLLDRLRREANSAADLSRFATRLRAELAEATRTTSWSALATWCRALFAMLIGEQRDRLPIEEQYAAVAIETVLGSLAELDALGEQASLQTLRDVLTTELAETLPRVGRFGEGVLVAPISAAIGLDLDVVYVLGLSEDLYPGRLAGDALLPDVARAATADELPARRELIDAKQRELLAAFACAGRSVASFPRGDLRRSSRRLPSRFLLPSLRELSGDTTLPATAWDTPSTYGDALHTAGSFAGELSRTPALASEQEWRTRHIAAGEPVDDAIVRAAVAMIRARRSEAFTRFDGNLSGAAGLPDYAAGERPVSPTALESYAECPHGFFVQRLLGVQPLEQPEDVVVISPIEIGNLVHGTVEALVTEFADRLPAAGEPWTPEQHRRLLEIAIERAEDFRRRGLTGHPRLWQRERDRIVDDLAWLLADDDRWRAEVDARVAASELPFGLDGEAPVEVAVPEGRVLMRGSADKVDVARDGRIYVTDIKTGSRSRFEDITPADPLAAGTKLQLPVYAYAARQRFGTPTTPVTAVYWFVRKGREKDRITVELTADVAAAYERTLSILVRSIAGGLFPPRAPEQPDYAYTQCPYCNPDGVGHADARTQWERKRSDPALRELVDLIEPGVLPPDPADAP